MKTRLMMSLSAAAMIACAAPTAATAQRAKHGDTLLMRRVQQEKHMHLPTRGMTMQKVQARFGAPQHKLAARGGDAPLHPLIRRWEYPGYIVYFEHGHVIHSVRNTPAGFNRHPDHTH